MKLSQRGLDLICSFEGYHTALPDGGCKAYLDKLAKPHIWTIGYGCTEGIYEGLVWTKEQAEAAFRRELAKHEQFVTQIVTVPLNQNEFDALVSFCYNLGPNNLRTLVANRLNKNKRMETAKSFPLYDKAGGKVYRGLVRRRYAEAALFAEPPADELEASPHMPQVVDAAKEPMAPGTKATIAVGGGAAGAKAAESAIDAIISAPPPAVADTVQNVGAWQSIGKTAVSISQALWASPVLTGVIACVAVAALWGPDLWRKVNGS